VLPLLRFHTINIDQAWPTTPTTTTLRRSSASCATNHPAPKLSELRDELEELNFKLKDYRKVLGVGRADAAAIKSAYRELIRKHHYDKNLDDFDGSTEQSFKLNAARDGLLRAAELEQLLRRLAAQPSSRPRRGPSGPRASADAHCPNDNCVPQPDGDVPSGYRCRKCGWEYTGGQGEEDDDEATE